MKRILLFCAACSVLLWSCAKDNIPSAEKSTVTFSLASSDEATRAYGEGSEVNDLRYAIFAQDDYSRPLVVRERNNEFDSSLSTTITEDLIAGHHYTIIFWADHDGVADTYIYNNARAYKIDWTNQSVTLNTSYLTANDETLDAFFTCKNFTAQVGGRVEVDLKRPFAQLNIATSDVELAASVHNATVTHTALEIKAYTTLNLRTGEVSALQPLTFDKAAIPSNERISVNGETYNRLSMNYILVGTQEQNGVSATLKAYGTKDGTADQQLFEATFDDLTLKRNRRTNVVGNIILSYMQ